ncbi:MAG: asparagine synthase (glutamine-hydrolyzing) [Candidatus Pelagibacter sp. TMED118]|nr:MAG: asparagine synthase (glutamine-hydrolyzing) [Candidatus Pelagibacter sp. TMED118]|tara:strand:+ start:382 stop:2049 length:1668 start_codon:yes stop_codon:yes gene_type:complete
MCGFTIFVSKKNKYKKKFIDKKILDHRGPDFFNTIKFKNILINHWRLSIVDLSAESNQPMENQNYIFAYNGEIYDYNFLSQKFDLNYSENSDTKFLFNLLCKKKNLNLLKNFSGFYSYAYLDKKKNKIYFSRDILGKKPLFFYKDNDKFIISSEEKGIFNFIKKEIEEKSIFEYFFYKNIHFDKTFYKNIKSIPPGAQLQFDLKKWNLKTNKTWTKYYNQSLFKKVNKENLNKSFRETFIKSIQKRNQCDVKTQLALSSGFDSALILNLIKKNTNIKNFDRAISIGFNKKNNETLIAKKIADTLNSKVHIINPKNLKLSNLEKIIKYYDAPLEHPNSIGVDLICKEAKKIDKVLITGEGADDLFFGYNHYHKRNKNSFAFKSFIRKGTLNKLLLNKENLEIFKKINSKTKLFFLRKKALSSNFFSRELEIKTHMLTLLKRNDRVSMKNSVEIRCPFLDINLIKLIPSKARLKKQIFLKQFFDMKIFKLVNKKKKIGFFIPLLKLYNSDKKKFKKYIDIAVTFFKNHGFSINKSIQNNNEIKWVLLNIGIFLKQNM